jgi:DNA polymerase III subunit alpha
VRDAYAKRLIVGVDAAAADNGFVTSLQQALAPFREGRCPVVVRYRSSSAQAMLRLGDEWRVRPSEELLKRLATLTAPDAVTLEY